MRQQRPLIIGHRGHELRPENTLESFLDAVNCGAEMLELDVWLSADRVPVVFHDEYLISRGENVGRIAQHELTALAKLELAGGAKIPTLERVLAELSLLAPLNIELKFYDLNYRPLVGTVLDLIRACGTEKRVLVSSFFHQALEIVHRAEPSIATAPIFGVPTGAPHEHDVEKLSRLPGWENETGLGKPAAVVDYLMIGPELVSDFNEAGLSLLAYTVDEPDDMRRMAELGVAGIITKRPGLLRQVLDKWTATRR